MRPINALLTLSVSLAAAISFSLAQSARGRLKPVVRQIDRILIETGDPRALYDLFTEDFQLPVAWPYVENARHASAGIGAGNVNLEVFRQSDSGRPRARFSGLALEPIDLEECLVQLRARGIDCGPPVPYVSRLPDGSEGTLWTNVVLSRLSSPDLTVFLCSYSPLFLNASVRRNQLGGELVLRRGGPLGVQSVREIVIASAEPAADRAAWQRLLVRPAGPAVRLVPGSETRILRIIIQVESLAAARDFLAHAHMLGRVTADSAAFASSKVQGLDIRLAGR